MMYINLFISMAFVQIFPLLDLWLAFVFPLFVSTACLCFSSCLEIVK